MQLSKRSELMSIRSNSNALVLMKKNLISLRYVTPKELKCYKTQKVALDSHI